MAPFSSQSMLRSHIKNMLPKSVFVVFIGFCVQFPNITLCTSAFGSTTDTSFCQEFRTKADRYINFFALDYFENEKLDDEFFRYKFFVKGREIFILFVENDSAASNTKCYEFGINTSNPPATIFKTTIDGSQKVRTEEKLPLSTETPILIEIIGRKDGEVHMFVANKPHPLIRFPDNTLQPKFISFASRAGNSATFYFNCERRRKDSKFLEDMENGLVIPDEHARPVVYFSFRINSITRSSEKVTLALHYNMTMFSNPNIPGVSERSLMLKLVKPEIQLPKLEIFSNKLAVPREVPTYSLSIDENKVTASADETLNVDCTSSVNIYCDLTFGLEDINYHLTHYPSGPPLSADYAKVANVKVFQSPNSASVSEIPLRGDVHVELKILA